MARASSTRRNSPIDSPPAYSSRRSSRSQRASTVSTCSRRARSRRRRAGRRSRSPTSPPPPPLHSSASSTLSSTESQPNTCCRWKVRRRPRRALRTADSLVTSMPSSTICPLTGVLDTRDAVEERCLARTVRPDQPVHRPAPHREVHVVDGGDATEPLRDAVGLEDRRSARSSVARFVEHVPPAVEPAHAQGGRSYIWLRSVPA